MGVLPGLLSPPIKISARGETPPPPPFCPCAIWHRAKRGQGGRFHICRRREAHRPYTHVGGVWVGITNMPSPRPLLNRVGLAAQIVPGKRGGCGQNRPKWPKIRYFGLFWSILCILVYFTPKKNTFSRDKSGSEPHPGQEGTWGGRICHTHSHPRHMGIGAVGLFPPSKT